RRAYARAPAHAGMPAVKDAVDIAFALAVVAAAATASGHAVLYKRDSRSAAIWLLLIWVLPALGALAYALLGVNRVERRAARKRAGVNMAVFNPPLVPARLHAMNLRNHRKILVVDGRVAFTGGMNVDCRYWKPEAPEQAYRDLHFRLRGPVVAHLMAVFADDWHFATEEALRGPTWFAPGSAEGSILARGIEAGPD